MADDPNKRGQQDRIRVNVHEEHELRYWTEKFRCTREELEAAVKQAGVMATDVEKVLQSS
jgi:hypothetical protein